MLQYRLVRFSIRKHASAEMNQMEIGKRRIVADLNALGLGRGDCVVVHSSFKSIGCTDGGPRAVIDALTEVVLPGGALLLPNLNIPHAFTTENPPRFDLKRDHLKQAIGIIPEMFKFEYATHFSIHPTHSMMGIGEKAPDILKDHEKAGLPCGPGTPWEKNALAGGRVLLIGVNQKCNTTYHCAEEQLEDSYQLSEDVIDGVVVIDGREMVVRSKLHVWWNHPDFNIINPELEAMGILRRGRVGRADTMCMDAAGFLDLCLAKMRGDSRYFLSYE